MNLYIIRNPEHRNALKLGVIEKDALADMARRDPWIAAYEVFEVVSLKGNYLPYRGTVKKLLAETTPHRLVYSRRYFEWVFVEGEPEREAAQ